MTIDIDLVEVTKETKALADIFGVQIKNEENQGFTWFSLTGEEPSLRRWLSQNFDNGDGFEEYISNAR